MGWAKRVMIMRLDNHDLYVEMGVLDTTTLLDVCILRWWIWEYLGLLQAFWHRLYACFAIGGG